MIPVGGVAMIAGGLAGLALVVASVRLAHRHNDSPARLAKVQRYAGARATACTQPHHFHRGAEVRRADGLVGTVRETWTHEAEVRLETGDLLRIEQFDPEWRSTATRSIEMPFARHSIRS